MGRESRRWLGGVDLTIDRTATKAQSPTLAAPPLRPGPLPRGDMELLTSSLEPTIVRGPVSLGHTLFWVRIMFFTFCHFL